MFKWMGKKAGEGAIDGAVSRVIDKITSLDFDLDKLQVVSKYLAPKEKKEFHANLARLVAAGVKIGAKAIEKKANS